MTNQGIQRTGPPVCHGNGEEHCCWVNGEVCEHLRENDPRAADGRRWSCGLLLTLQATFPQLDLGRVWERLHRHPQYTRIKEAFEARGVAMCGNWLGGILPDGTIRGQCCFEGYTFDADGNVIAEP